MIDRAHLSDSQDFRGEACPRSLLIVGEHVISQLVRGRKLAAVDFCQHGDVLRIIRLARSEIFVGQVIAQPVGIPHIATKQGADRVQLQFALVRIGEKREQFIMFASLGGNRSIILPVLCDGRNCRERERKSCT